MALTAWDEDAIARARASNIALNGARTARSFHRIASKGAGEIHMAQPVPFAVTFTEQPTLTSGLALGAGQLVPGAYPIAQVGVHKWQTDSRGFFIGAYLWIAVTFGPDSLSTDGSLTFLSHADQIARAQAMNRLQLDHHLCFEGMALRDVNVDAVEGN